MEAFEGAMKSEAGKEATAYDGVLPETLVILLEAKSLTSVPGGDRTLPPGTRAATPDSASALRRPVPGLSDGLCNRA